MSSCEAGRRARLANKGVGAWLSSLENTCGSWRAMQIGGVANLSLSLCLCFWLHVWLERRAGQKEQVRYFSHTAAGESVSAAAAAARPPWPQPSCEVQCWGPLFHSGSYTD